MGADSGGRGRIGYDWGMRLGDLPFTRPAAVLLGAALLLGGAACSGEDEPDSPAASSSPSAEPGPEVAVDSATFQAPSGFELGEETGQGAVIATGPSGGLLSLVEVDFPGEAPDIKRQAEIALDGLGDKFTAEEPIEVDGVEMWHLSGKESKGTFADVYGAIVDGTAVRLTVRLGNDEYDAEQRAAANQQVLDSWSWAAA